MSEQPTDKQKNFLNQRKHQIPATKDEATVIIGQLIAGQKPTQTTFNVTKPDKEPTAQERTTQQDCEELYQIETSVKTFFANNNEQLINEKIGLYVKLIWMGRHA